MNSSTAFDKRWETIFQQQGWGKYPSEEAIRFTAKNYYSVDNRAETHMLDLGCGGGATSWFLAKEGFKVTAIDGSQSAITQAEALLKQEHLTADLKVVDFIRLPFDDCTFDAVYDLNAIQHNNINAINTIYSEVARVLKPGGRLLSVCLNDQTSVGKGSVEIEKNTYSKIETLNHSVTTHLFCETDITLLKSYFCIEAMSTLTKQHDDINLSHYILQCIKA